MARRASNQKFTRVDIRTEDEAWALLEMLARDDTPDRRILPSVKSWPKMEFTFWIDGKNAVLTAPVMRAMLDYQDGINRAFMLLSEGSSNLRGLSEEERGQYEAIFKIGRGSTKVDIDLQELCREFGKLAIDKMSGKHVAIIAIVFALLFAGDRYWNAWLEHQKEITAAESSNQQVKELLAAQKFASEADLQKFKLMHDVVQMTMGNTDLIDASDEGRKGVLKAAARVDKAKVGSATIPPEIAKPMARSARTASEKDTITNSYEVLRVDTDVADGFRVRLRDIATQEEFFASVRERLLSENDRKLIQEGEWSKRPIEARVLVTRRRGEIVEARIAEVLRVVTTGDTVIAENEE